MANQHGNILLSARKILWVDCTAAFLAGAAVIALSGWLSQLHGLPQGLLLFIGAANLVYATYSFTLARWAARPLSLIRLLVYANWAWVIVCMALAATFWDQASPFGIAHLLGEAAFVGTLATMEWRQRHRLAGIPGASEEGLP